MNLKNLLVLTLVLRTAAVEENVTIRKLCTKIIRYTVSTPETYNAVRVVTRRRFFGIITRNELYTATRMQNSINYKTISVCCFGFESVGDSDNCVPICDPACSENSVCYAPRKCRCKEGYNRLGFGRCIPNCQQNCPEHSECTAPNHCECLEGYIMLNGTCTPNCGKTCPEHSYCQAPGNCVCNEGYFTEQTNGKTVMVCLPECKEGCPINSFCEKPGVCTCYTGYRLTDDHYCEPVCTPSCGNNSVCSAPDHCDCLKGYENLSLNNICQPVCRGGCPALSICDSPETCRCKDGYTMNGTECVPSCKEPCPEQSICIQPDKCACNDGYILKDSPGFRKYCEPICQLEVCLDFSFCVAPNVCECSHGYERDLAQSNSSGEFRCLPKCSKGCSNGFCFRPEVCVCNSGYLKGPNNECVPTCSLGCFNGKCVEPEICECNTGYRLVSNSVSNCEPVCEPSCVHSDCVAPDLCLCQSGYEPDESKLSQTGLVYTCKPTCSSPCIHGACNEPDKCSCDDGYEEIENKCVPQCENCMNGTCVAPGECQCWPHYEFNSLNDGNQLCTPMTTSSSTTDGDSSTTYDTSLAGEFIEDIIITCQAKCKCWKELDEYDTVAQMKCANICVDDFDEPCLNLSNCKCNSRDLQLNCNRTEGSREYYEETRYVCTIHFFPTTASTPLQQESRKSKSGAFIAFWTVVACIVGLCLTTILILAKRCYATNRSNGDYSIEYNGQTPKREAVQI